MKTIYFTDSDWSVISKVYYTSTHEWDSVASEWVSNITPLVSGYFPSCAVLYPGIIKYLVYTSIDGQQCFIEIGGIPKGVLHWDLREATHDGAEAVDIPMRCYITLKEWQIRGDRA